MKVRLLVGTLAAQLLHLPAGAADLSAPVIPSDVIASPISVAQWDGAYLGAAVGIQFFRNWGMHGNAAGILNPAFPDYAYDYTRSTLSYGLYAGSQKQFGRMVVGLEADIDGPSRLQSQTYIGSPAYGQNAYIQRLSAHWQGSMRARFGVVVSHHTLLFATGGIAFGRFTHCSIIDDCQGNTGHVNKYTSTRLGWTIGLGVEHKFNDMWSVRAEYRYTNFGSRNCNNTPDCAFPLFAGDPINASDINNRVESHAVRVGITYHFTEQLSPITARY